MQQTQPARTGGWHVPMTHAQNPEISVVIPVYDEEKNIEPLYDELSAALNDIGVTYEVIVVDDGSRDNSFEELKKVYERDPRWQVIQFRRNFGQTAGFSAGFDHASGDTIITIDADLQNDPRDIPKLLEKMKEGYDIVSGWRVDRKEPFLSRRLPSMTANRMISWMTGVHLHDYGCSLKAYVSWRRTCSFTANSTVSYRRWQSGSARKWPKYRSTTGRGNTGRASTESGAPSGYSSTC